MTPGRSPTSPTTGPPGRVISCSSHGRSCPGTSWLDLEPFSFTARDGLTVHGYATFPPGAERTPTVLNVHGGPWARDSWGFDPEAQWARQPAVLCVRCNRGSTGYGKAFVNAGDREWGRDCRTTSPTLWPMPPGRGGPTRRRSGGCSTAATQSPRRRNVRPGPCGRPGGPIAQFTAGRGPGQGCRLPLVQVPAVPGGRLFGSAADRPGADRQQAESGAVAPLARTIDYEYMCP